MYGVDRVVAVNAVFANRKGADPDEMQAFGVGVAVKGAVTMSALQGGKGAAAGLGKPGGNCSCSTVRDLAKVWIHI